jgi:hypothetical protein
MRSAEMLVGTDVELMPTGVYGGMLSAKWWDEWISRLALLPPKGARRYIRNDYWTHRDGLSVELGFAPTPSPDEFIDKLSTAKELVEQMMGGTTLTAVDWFDITAIMHDPDMESYLELGCSPDLVVLGDGQDYQQRELPDAVREEGTRECGGHFHVSLPPPFLNNKELRTQFVKALDDGVYPLVTMNLGDYRSWYRHRNVFRWTDYGIEYRSLGATALYGPDAEAVIRMVYDAARSAWEV